MRYRFTNPFSPGRPLHSHRMLQLLEVRTLPREGMPARMLPGLNVTTKAPVEIRVWVAPHVPKFGKRWNGSDWVPAPVKTSVHRVRCACPGCGVELSAGRLFQHRCAVKPGEITSAELADEELLRTRNAPGLSLDAEVAEEIAAGNDFGG